MPGRIRAVRLWALFGTVLMLIAVGVVVDFSTARSEDTAPQAPVVAPGDESETQRAAAPASSEDVRMVVQEETVPPPVKVQVSKKLRQGLSVVKQAGRSGKRKAIYRVTYQGDQEVSRNLIKTIWVSRPFQKVIMVGAQKNLPSRGYFSGRKVLSMVATGYDPGPGSCGPNATGRTYLGLKAGYGVVAVDPKYIPLGTRLYIEGYGYAIAGDVGGKIKGNRIDLGHDSFRAAFRVGMKKVKVYILD